MDDKVATILAAYVGISWLLAFLLFYYEFIMSPMFIVPIPLDKFTIIEYTLIIPSSIVFGILYAEAIKEDNDE